MAATKKAVSKRPAKDPSSNAQQRFAKRTAASLTPAAKALRDRFIAAYLQHFNATNAYIEAGGTSKRPGKAGYELRHEAYVAQTIQQAIDAMNVDAMATNQRVMSWAIREANHYGFDASHGARVSMITTLMKHKGLSGEEREAAAAARGGVMVVPATDNVDSWEARAAAAQAALKEQVRE